jgi:hypothetical protein
LNGFPVEYLRAKKRKRTVEYDSTYYQSPLDQSDIKGKGKYSEKRHALDSIHTVYDRLVQDIDRLFETLSKANELESGEDTEGEQEDPVVVEPDMAAEDAQKVPGETPVKEEESEKKNVKIVESAVKKEEEEEEEKPLSLRSLVQPGAKEKRPLSLRRSDCAKIRCVIQGRNYLNWLLCSCYAKVVSTIPVFMSIFGTLGNLCLHCRVSVAFLL